MCRSTPQSTVRISTRLTCRELIASQGAESSYKNLPIEPPDHAIGRSRGGLSTKIHRLVDGRCRPLVILLGPGQGGDSPMFAPLLEQLSVARIGPGRPRTRPDRILGDKAYSSRANRATLRSRGIQAVISEPSDQKGHRRRRGRAGGRPPAFDANAYRTRNTVERSFSEHKQCFAIATRYDFSATRTCSGIRTGSSKRATASRCGRCGLQRSEKRSVPATVLTREMARSGAAKGLLRLPTTGVRCRRPP